MTVRLIAIVLLTISLVPLALGNVGISFIPTPIPEPTEAIVLHAALRSAIHMATGCIVITMYLCTVTMIISFRKKDAK